jgi:hypothetical protein
MEPPMSYSTYWTGELSITPVPPPQTVNTINAFWKTVPLRNDSLIDDPHVVELFSAGDFKYYTPWSPFENPGEHTYDKEGRLWWTLEAMAESGFPHVIAALITIFAKHILPAKYRMEGTLWWDGDEQDDFGVLRIVDRDHIWVCHAELTYPEPDTIGSDLFTLGETS